MHMNKIPRYPVTIGGETTYIGTANELAIALDVLHGQHDRAVLEQLRPHLADIANTPAGFTLVVKSLAPAEQILLIAVLGLGVRMASILREARYLRDLLATMAYVEVEQRLLDPLAKTGDCRRQGTTAGYQRARLG